MTTNGSSGGHQEWLHLVIVVALAAYLIIGIIAWVWMLVVGIEVPDAFATVLAAIIGAFAGMLSPIRRPSRATNHPGSGGQAPPPGSHGT